MILFLGWIEIDGNQSYLAGTIYTAIARIYYRTCILDSFDFQSDDFFYRYTLLRIIKM